MGFVQRKATFMSNEIGIGLQQVSRSPYQEKEFVLDLRKKKFEEPVLTANKSQLPLLEGPFVL